MGKLKGRRREALTDLLALHPPADLAQGSNGFWSGATACEQSPAQLVWGRWQPKRTRDHASDLSLSPGQRSEEAEVIRLPLSAQIGPGWLVQVMTPRHPQRGQWLEVAGPGQMMARRAEVQIWSVKRVAPPAWEAG